MSVWIRVSIPETRLRSGSVLPKPDIVPGIKALVFRSASLINTKAFVSLSYKFVSVSSINIRSSFLKVLECQRLQ